MQIKNLPACERPRERLVKYGPGKLSNAELLAILLRSGVQGVNVIELSKKILKKFGNDLSKTSVAELAKTFGLGMAKACEIVACFELGKRFLQDKPAALILSPKDVWENLKEIRDHKKEHFIIFYLDSRNREIQKEIISVGTLNANLVHPREVFEPAVKNLAAQIIVAHNHPSGQTDPSEEDLAITKRLIEAGKLLGIEVLDHVIVAQKEFSSFKEKGII
jgi:DNA repair protein RadC